MTPIARPQMPVHSSLQPTSHGASALKTQTSSDPQNSAEARKIHQAAHDFETIFLRQMLSALEKTTKVGDKGPNVAGQQTYGSMIVEAVADAVAQAGGIGLGAVMAKALGDKAGGHEAEKTLASDPEKLSPTRQPLDQAVDSGAARGAVAFVGNSPQGLPSRAVPPTEIRTTTPQLMGQLADRRIR